MEIPYIICTRTQKLQSAKAVNLYYTGRYSDLLLVFTVFPFCLRNTVTILMNEKQFNESLQLRDSPGISPGSLLTPINNIGDHYIANVLFNFKK